MRRRLEIGLALLLATGILALLFLRSPKASENLIILDGRASSTSAFQEEATLRNVLNRDIEYLIEYGPDFQSLLSRTLAVGAVDRISTDAPVRITIDNGSRRLTTTIFPGEPYSLRYDESGWVKVYPGSHGREDAADLAPFVPTPVPVVEKMLEMAAVSSEDIVYDIGCGDGRMIITAARKYSAQGVGIDIDSELIKECRRNAREAGVEGFTRFIRMDATRARFTEASVVAVYLLPESLDVLRPLFERDLKPGTRVVSHNYRVSGWEDKLVAREVIQDERGLEHKIYLYRR
jgi:SAM-dependent methyltransferase